MSDFAPVNPDGNTAGPGGFSGGGTGGGDHEYHQWNGLTPSEKELLTNNPTIVFKLQSNKDAAFKMTTKYFPNVVNAHNNAADAFRHAYFNALNAQSFGYDLALKLGYAHEMYPDNPTLEFKMDVFNNMVGRDIGSQNWWNTPDGIANIVYNNLIIGQLMMIYNNQLVPTFVPKK